MSLQPQHPRLGSAVTFPPDEELVWDGEDGKGDDGDGDEGNGEDGDEEEDDGMKNPCGSDRGSLTRLRSVTQEPNSQANTKPFH